MLRINHKTEEDELLSGCIKRRPKAQEALYTRLAPKMLGVCVRYINDRNEAEHVMVGGMIKVFEKIEQYSGEGSLEGWVRRIMVNESLMYLRKHQAMSIEVEISEAETALNFKSLEDNLSAEDLLRLINELPIGYKTVFNLYAIEGYSHKEIAEMLAISIQTSKSQLSRARKLLQNKLAKLEKIELKDVNGNGTGK